MGSVCFFRFSNHRTYFRYVEEEQNLPTSMISRKSSSVRTLQLLNRMLRRIGLNKSSCLMRAGLYWALFMDHSSTASIFLNHSEPSCCGKSNTGMLEKAIFIKLGQLRPIPGENFKISGIDKVCGGGEVIGWIYPPPPLYSFLLVYFIHTGCYITIPLSPIVTLKQITFFTHALMVI